MEIAIIGGNGFIGKYFIEEYSRNFSQINVLSRTLKPFVQDNITVIKGTMGDKEAINRLIAGVDIVLHAGFDHQYQENIIGINNVLDAISVNKTSKLIYLSSYIVYDLISRNDISEANEYSQIKDIYTVEKLKIEKTLKEFAQKYPQKSIIVLQPTIVYGLRGNWTNTFIKATKYSEVKIPNKGFGVCPLIYVKDVVLGIYLSTQLNQKVLSSNYEKILLSSDENITWQDVYIKHQEVVKSIKNVSTPLVFSNSYSGRYGTNWVKDCLIRIVFSKSLGLFFNPILKFIKNRIHNKERLGDIINQPALNHPFEMVGLYKFLHSANRLTNTAKAKNILGFKPKFSLYYGINDIIKTLKE